MRIYEFSKKFDVAVKNVISALKERGVRRADAELTLTDSHITFLKRKFHVKGEAEAVEERIVVKADIPEQEMFLGDLSDALGRPSSELIIALLKQGIVASKNQLLKKEVVAAVVKSYGANLIAPNISNDEAKGRVQDDLDEEQAIGESRSPIVAVVGHVDHGKTTLLDTIRKTKVASREAGGITQAIGAYAVGTSHGEVVFIDTPGHEAFAVMRERGVKVADIVALIVAADDGVKPQTVECIKAIQTLQVPMIVIINKVDKASKTQIETVKRQLSEHGILSDEWGGDVPFVEVSAQEGLGVDEMLDILALQSDMLHLSANKKAAARGYVLESHVQRGRGAVASLILHCGELRVGDIFVCGNTFGKVSSIENCRGKRVKKVGPSTPVIVAGFDALPSAGDLLKIATAAEVKKHKNSIVAANQKKLDVSVDAINIIVKAGSSSSRESLVQAIEKIEIKRTTPVRIINSGVGHINASDVELAENTGSMIFGLDVKLERNAEALKSIVKVKTYNIIYRLIDDLREIVAATKEPEYEIDFIGRATVKAVFKIKSSFIAGAGVEEGQIQKDGILIVTRGSKKLAEGEIISLQREKSNVDVVPKGSDCAFKIKGFDAWKIGDVVECITKKEIFD